MNTSLTINSTKNLIMWYKVTHYNALHEFDQLQFILFTHTMRYGAINYFVIFSLMSIHVRLRLKIVLLQTIFG